MNEDSMKKAMARTKKPRPATMRTEYDFKSLKNGVRGKYYKSYRAGHTVKIHRADGTVSVQHFKVEDGAVILERDVRKYFPDSDSVNKALRCLIPLVRARRSKKEPTTSKSHAIRSVQERA